MSKVTRSPRRCEALGPGLEVEGKTGNEIKTAHAAPEPDEDVAKAPPEGSA